MKNLELEKRKSSQQVRFQQISKNQRFTKYTYLLMVEMKINPKKNMQLENFNEKIGRTQT